MFEEIKIYLSVMTWVWSSGRWRF